jgi:hypothetical protein
MIVKKNERGLKEDLFAGMRSETESTAGAGDAYFGEDFLPKRDSSLGVTYLVV